MKESQSQSVGSHGSFSNTEPDARIQRLPAELSSTSRGERPPPRQSPEGASEGRPDPTSCFCWCTCSPERPPMPPPKPGSKEHEEPVSQEEIRGWGESFDRLMQSHRGRQEFCAFLRSEFSDSNLLFWLACEELKTIDNPLIIQSRVLEIYDEYISEISPKEVSLDARVRGILERTKNNPTNKIYEEAQLQIYTLMQRDPYPRFVNSTAYKRLITDKHVQLEG